MYRVGVKIYGFIAKLDTMYRVGVHKPHYAHQLNNCLHQLDTMY
mgnify:FL=1